jgi:hypothetical protein
MSRKHSAKEEKDGSSPLILIPTAIETLPTTAERVEATLAQDHK